MNILFFFSMILIINYLNLIFFYIFFEKEYLLKERKVIMTCKAFDELENKKKDKEKDFILKNIIVLIKLYLEELKKIQEKNA